MNNKFGFTLAEVMVVLVTLGVLAAITIPAVIHIKPDNKKVMLKKAYSTFEQSIQNLINNEQYYPSSETFVFNAGPPVVYMPKGFNYNTITSGMGITDSPSPDKFCYLLANSMNTLGTVTCPSSGAASFTSADGILWSMTTNSAANIEFPLVSTSYFDVIVDVNGIQTPNCGAGTACSAGVVEDRYKFSVRYDGKIQIDDAGANLLTNPTVNH